MHALLPVPLLLVVISTAMPPTDRHERVASRVKAQEAELLALRREIHEHPHGIRVMAAVVVGRLAAK